MAGKRYCPFEGDFFPPGEFRVVSGTLIHDVEPQHRATDGMTVTVDDDDVVVEASAAAEAMAADAMPDDER